MYSTFQRRLAAGQTVITGEVAPPKGAGRATVERLVGALRGYIDAVNLTDNQRGVARMSALGGGIIAHQMGIEPIVQVTCQNRNQLALQADLLAGSALGVPNFLCMTGDHPRSGDHPDAKHVLDVNSFKLIKMFRTLRDEHCFNSGAPLKDEAPAFFLGGVANPNIEKVARLERKIEAGAEFIQTQLIFDTGRFREWMADVRAAGLHQQAHILAGVLIPRTAKTVMFLHENLPGMRIPESTLERMQRADDAEHEGINLSTELVQDLLSVEGVAGVHLMSVAWTRAMPQVIEQAGLLPRPPLPEQPA
jgi:methylenetetrahydrofolate reductase (NADPH)